MAATMGRPFWRLANSTDLDEINRIADQIHVSLPERAEVFAEKFALFPEGCFVFVLEGALLGYGLSHPWNLYDIPALDTFLEVLPERPGCLFIHDVAILPEGRGSGGAEQYVELAVSIARRLHMPFLALVSVYNTSELWSRAGFNAVHRAELSRKLECYGDGARYMIRKLG
jgi:hypothetical protein